ncbi:MAG: DUF6636 domain-containing protein [Thermoleophilia bacterium]|jgi:hypothetical protein
MITSLRVLIAGAAAAAAIAGAAGTASAAVTFATPTLNIGCHGTAKDVRCDIRSSSARRPPKPRVCDFDWGTAFGLTRRGKGRGLCVSDTVLPDPGRPPRILRYGRSIRVNARIVCTSRRTGLTCRNAAGHGFLLSKQRIRLY